ncbi:MAG TPA: hypothetical protein VFK13_14055 [Gemmatimonadaceae bacterium]|nr:hypothetical protein [Gemmatimonadaceae bacterium]
MTFIRSCSWPVLALLACVAAPAAARAQDTTSQRGVRIGLTYQAGTRPGIVVLPVRGMEGGDSLRAILERDLDFSDAVQVIGMAGTAARQAVEGAGTGPINYALWKSLGAAGIVQTTPSAGGVTVAVHDVAQRKVLSTRSFALPSGVLGGAWRMAVHGISDELVRMITGARGIAQSRILYVRGGRVYVIDSDGYGERALTSGSGALSPAWNPNGRSIAYSRMGGTGTEVLIQDLAAGTAQRLPGMRPGLNITPVFSPNGSTLVYAHGEESGTDLYAVDAFGAGGGSTTMRRLTVGRGSDNVSPSFSPDGRHLAMTSGRAGHPEVYTLDVDGSNVELLTPFNFGDQNYRSNPDWAPDGRLIAFQSQIAGQFQVMTITLRDRTVKQHTSEGINEDPSWAPDSRHLVFTSNRTGVRELWVLDTESGRARQLTHAPGARMAAWSGVLGAVP